MARHDPSHPLGIFPPVPLGPQKPSGPQRVGGGPQPIPGVVPYHWVGTNHGYPPPHAAFSGVRLFLSTMRARFVDTARWGLQEGSRERGPRVSESID
jgi:hypothetical protein